MVPVEPPRTAEEELLLEPLRTAEKELLGVVVPVEPLRTADEELRLVLDELRTPVEVLRAADEVLLTPLAVRLRTADEETAAVVPPEVRRPSILAVEVRALLEDTRLLPVARRTEDDVMSLAIALRFTLLLMEVAWLVSTLPLL